MCLFISGVITPEKTYFLVDNDSHTAIREFFHIMDDVCAPRPINSVNVELVPIDDNIFNLDPSNWQLNVDQQEVPEWFTNSVWAFAKQEMLLCLEQRAKRRFYINNQERVTVEDGIYYALNSIVNVTKHAEVHAYGNSKIYARDRSIVYAYDNSDISSFDYAIIIRAKDNSTVSLYDHSCCIEALDRVCIEANSLSSAKVFSPEVAVRVDEYAVVRVYIHPKILSREFSINFNNYQLGIYGRPILDFTYQNKMFTKDTQLRKE